MDCDSSISQFDALQHDDVLPLAQCIGQLPPTQKTVLAMYYHENLEPTEIAACLGLTECEIDQIRAQTVEFLQTRLTAQIALAGRPETKPFNTLAWRRSQDLTGLVTSRSCGLSET